MLLNSLQMTMLHIVCHTTMYGQWIYRLIYRIFTFKDKVLMLFYVITHCGHSKYRAMANIQLLCLASMAIILQITQSIRNHQHSMISRRNQTKRKNGRAREEAQREGIKLEFIRHTVTNRKNSFPMDMRP